MIDGSYGRRSVVEIAATDTSAEATFSDGVHKVMVMNRDAANAVYIEFDKATVTTSDIRIGPDRELIFPVECRRASAICEAGQTATVQFIGLF